MKGISHHQLTDELLQCCRACLSGCMLQGMQETYSTYLDSIQAALNSGNGSGDSCSGAVASQSAAAAAAEAAVNSDPLAGNGASAISSPVQGPMPATPPGKVTPQQQQQPPPQWVAGSPVAMQLWSRWFRDLVALSLLLLTLWLLRRALEEAAAGAAAAGSGSSAAGFSQGRRVVFRQGSPWPLLQATPAAISQ